MLLKAHTQKCKTFFLTLVGGNQMGRKKKIKFLALFQSKKKRRRRNLLRKYQNTDDISTEEYSNHSEEEITVKSNDIISSTSNNDLDEILEWFNDLSKSMIESIATEYSDLEDMEKYTLLLHGGYKETSSSSSELDEIETVGKQIVSNIQKYINVQSPEMKVRKWKKQEDLQYKFSKRKCIENKSMDEKDECIIESCEEDANHDLETCSCHLPKHLEYVVNMIESKELFWFHLLSNYTKEKF